MNISFLNYIDQFESIPYDYFWVSLKSYVEDNYKGSISWNWNWPHKYSSAHHIDELVEKILKEEPDILIVSLYVWNHGLSVKVAEKVKLSIPNCIVLFGGPHLLYKSDKEYFKKNWFVDFLCESDGYGEVFMNEFLYQLETDKDWKNVPFLVKPNEDRESFFKSTKFFNKRSFVWPSKIYERNKDYFLDLKDESVSSEKPLYIHYESSRGCPFGCTYCEWGGGISSKTNFKPDNLVFDDLDFIFEVIRPDLFSFTDANFGIVPRDVEIAKKICEYKNDTGFPQSIYLYGPTKVRKENLYKIEEMFAANGLSNTVKIPVQDLNPIVNVNIKRTDDHWKDQLKEYMKIKEKHDIKIQLEMILGLPGSTIDSYYESLTESKKNNVGIVRYEWFFLPTAPAADKEYMKEHGIKTIKIRPTNTFSGNTFTRKTIISANDRASEVLKETPLVSHKDYAEDIEIVVATNSYSESEWAQMWLMDKVAYVGETHEYLKPITNYIQKYSNIDIGVFYRIFWNSFLNSDSYLKGKQLTLMKSIIEQLKDKMKCNDKDESFFYFKTLHNEVLMKGVPLIKYLINMNRYRFYESLKEWANDEFGDDPLRDDLISWNSNMIKWIDYTPGKYGFFSKYDWSTWLKTGEILELNRIIRPKDLFMSSGEEIKWINKDMSRRVKEHFFPMCSDDRHYSQLFSDLEVV